MYLAQVTFPISQPRVPDHPDSRKREEQDKKLCPVYRLLGAWKQNGQVLEDAGLHWLDEDVQLGYVRSYVTLPAQDALNDCYSNSVVEDLVSQFVRQGQGKYEVTILGAQPDSLPNCTCTDYPGLILWTTFLAQTGASLQCTACQGIVPLYQPEFTQNDRSDILAWASAYQAFDTLQMQGTAESFSEHQMGDLHSEVNQSGLEITQRLRDRLHKPVFYYLYRGKGQSQAAEETRRCPSCDGEWRLQKAWEPWGLFHFRCDCCCLVSNAAFDIAEQ